MRGWMAKYQGGKQTEYLFFGYDATGGFTKHRVLLDDLGRAIKHVLLDDDHPALDPNDGIAGWLSEYRRRRQRDQTAVSWR